MRRGMIATTLILCVTLFSGCVSVSFEVLSEQIESQELSDHVHFLSQPALKGRKSRSWGSATARKYITNKFQEYGLKPWAQTQGYEQAFGLGTNIVGILPGADPNLADEIVILTAHYDHLGKGKNGSKPTGNAKKKITA